MSDTTDRKRETKYIKANETDWQALKVVGALHSTHMAGALSLIIDCAFPHLSAMDQAAISHARTIAS